MSTADKIRAFTEEKIKLQLSLELIQERELLQMDIEELVRNPVAYMRTFFLTHGIPLIRESANKAKAIGEELADTIGIGPERKMESTES